MLNDLRLAFHKLLKNPGFTAVAVLTLAFGIGAYPAASAAPAQATASDRIEMIDIGGRKLQLLSRGTSTPAVVIEAGMGEPAVESGSWRKVIDEISKTNRVIVYDRAGLGKSDPAPKLPRTSLDVANDLNALLTTAGVAGPYLLVGHSYGGMHLRMFASQYPGKVLGMVLVDSAHPESNSTLRQSTSGGHYLHVEDPELVIQGVRHALDAAKKRAN